MQFGFVLLIFYSAEFAIENLFFLLEKHVKHEMIMFSIINQISDILWMRNDYPNTDEDKVLCAKVEIPWRHQKYAIVQKMLDDLYTQVRDTEWR
jgi:hypothetical protein